MFINHKYNGTDIYNAVLERLKLIASNRRRTDYSTVFAIMNLSPGNYAAKEAGHLLGEICDQMHKEGKSMLSALVVRQDTGKPGPGFFEMATKLGRLPANASEQERDEFWKREVNAVFATNW